MLVLAALAAPLQAYPLDPDIHDTYTSTQAYSSGNVHPLRWMTDDIFVFYAWISRETYEPWEFHDTGKMLNEEYIVFHQYIDPELGMAERMVGPLTMAATPTLKTDTGIEVEAVVLEPDEDLMERIESGFGRMPLLFPKKDAEGNDVITDETKSFTVTIQYEEREEASVFTWELPLEKTKMMKEALDWFDEEMKKMEKEDKETEKE